MTSSTQAGEAPVGAIDLVVFSHLRWDFVYQRPQHLLSRLARHRRVFFIEEPVHEDGTEPGWPRSSPVANVELCRPVTPLRSAGFSDEQLSAVAPLVRRLANQENLASCL